MVKCPYCNKNAELVNGDILYPHRPDLKYLKFYRCLPCDAYVGCHKKHPQYSPKGDTPLGRLANKKLRSLKRKVHNILDPLWKRETKSRQRYSARKAVYKRLANEMGISLDDTHVGMFDEVQCEEALKIIKEWGSKGDADEVEESKKTKAK